jgi:UDP-3-O-[3-hydroxymyristoyl] glucosamine N-acyltransferase
MFRVKRQEVRASDVASYLNSNLEGEDFLLEGPHVLRTPKTAPRGRAPEASCLLLTDGTIAKAGYRAVVTSKTPELHLAQVLNEFFATPPRAGVHPTAQVAEGATLGRNLTVGAHVVIGADVTIGDGTRIMHNVVIHGPARIGKGCVIKDGAVVGSEGYGFVEDEEGRLVHVPQLGRVLVGDRVWIGANSTIERGPVVDTVIEDDVKIDDLVHVGNGSRVGRKSLLTAGVVLSSDVVVGEGVTLFPGAVVRGGVQVCAGATVGLGATVVGDITTPGAWVGVPARRLEG